MQINSPCVLSHIECFKMAKASKVKGKGKQRGFSNILDDDSKDVFFAFGWRSDDQSGDGEEAEEYMGEEAEKNMDENAMEGAEDRH